MVVPELFSKRYEKWSFVMFVKIFCTKSVDILINVYKPVTYILFVSYISSRLHALFKKMTKYVLKWTLYFLCGNNISDI
jgi:hypothetical protein